MSFLFKDKPAGSTTLSESLGKKLYDVRRLDRETTGLFCLAESNEEAQRLQALFDKGEVEISFLFITDRKIQSPPPQNLSTVFELIKETDGASLWRAKPASSANKSSQIRLDADKAGLAILGDTANGGSAFPTLCLHCYEIAFEIDDQAFKETAPAPYWFDNLELVRDPLLSRWLTAVDRRERWLRSTGQSAETLRWIHTEGDPLRVEQLGEVLALSWFKDRAPNEREQASIDRLIEILKEKTGAKRWYFQIRGNRGRTPNEEPLKFSPGEFPPRWEAKENLLMYGFRVDSGLSAGLFLDQRRNRLWVREQAPGQTVLNLFSYTGGFSVSAASGGAAKTVSVDVSKTFLEWTKENFTRNDLTQEGHEFRAMDSREYLAWAKKKGLRFDLIICDPPSFSRASGKSGLFRIEHDFVSLLNSLIDVTQPGGQILFSSNYEAWTLEQFELEAKKTLQTRKAKLVAHLAPTPPPDWDFELPLEPHNMKSFLVKISEIK